jgi:hypothetical protein
VRFMISFRVPTERENAAVMDGSLPNTLQSVLEDLKPEAAYFADIEGARGGYLVVNMDDASQIPAIADPLFLAIDATVQSPPCSPRRTCPGRWRVCSKRHRSTARSGDYQVGRTGDTHSGPSPCPIHRSAWKVNSANFALTEF